MLRVVTAILSRLCTRSSEGSSAARNSGGATYLRAGAHSEPCGVNTSTGMPNIASVYTPGQTPEQTTTASNTTAICPSFTRTVHPCLPSHANTLPIAPTSFMAVQPAHMGPSMALRIETFGYHGSLSRYTPKRGRSVPLPTSQQVQYEGQERPGTRPRRAKSEGCADREFLRPLVNRDGIVTFGRQSITITDIIPPLVSRPRVLYPVYDGQLFPA